MRWSWPARRGRRFRACRPENRSSTNRCAANWALPNLTQRHALSLARLRRVLQAAPRLHVTYAAEQPGEPAQLSPWIEAIESHAISLGLNLCEATLAAQAGTAATEIAMPAAMPALRRSLSCARARRCHGCRWRSAPPRTSA